MAMVYSRNNEYFIFESMAEILSDMNDDGDLVVGNIFWQAEAEEFKASEFFSADSLIEDAQTQAYDHGGEWAEDFGDDISKEAKAELERLISEWADKHVSVRFWRCKDAKEVVVTEQMVSEYSDKS